MKMLKIIISSLFLLSVHSILCINSFRIEKTCGKSKAILFKESNKSHRMVEISFSNQSITDCMVYGDKKLAEKTLSQKLCPPKVVYVSQKELSEWALFCSDWLTSLLKKRLVPTYSDNDFPEEYNNKIDRYFFDGILIYPGTKWCGAGDVAEDYDDLGSEEETDKCCRAHDHCFDAIPSGETKYELKNKAIHTKTHCECDHQFKACLKLVEREVSARIAKLFFNVIQIQCFQKDHPIVDCLEYKGIPLFWRSCQKYELDESKPQIYQFFDALFVD